MTNTLYTIPTLTRVPERGIHHPDIDQSLILKTSSAEEEGRGHSCECSAPLCCYTWPPNSALSLPFPGMTNTLYTIPTLTRVPERGKIPPKIDPGLGLKRLNRQLPRPLPPGTWPKASDEADGDTGRPQPVFEVQLSQTSGDLGGLAGADMHCQQLAKTVGAGDKTWRAYLSSNHAALGGVVNARDRIGKGLWLNAKGVVIAKDLDDLHSSNNNLNQQTALTERGAEIGSVGMTPLQHDILTGSAPDGQAFPANINATCNNWTSSTFGTAMVGHSDRQPNRPSWNSAHQSRACSQPDLVATGGNGLFYCFAQ